MKMNKYAYCNECEDLVEFDVIERKITEQYKGEMVEFKFDTGRCKCCGSEVATDIGYNTRRLNAKIKAYEHMKSK